MGHYDSKINELSNDIMSASCIFCSKACSGSCSGICKSGCNNTCKSSCKGSCSTSCKNGYRFSVMRR